MVKETRHLSHAVRVLKRKIGVMSTASFRRSVAWVVLAWLFC